MTLNKVVAILLVGLLFVLGTTAISQPDRENKKNDPPIDTSEIAYWRDRIQAVGAPGAYEELSCRFKDEHDARGHKEGHIFGAALYLENGLGGISVCDDQFRYACLHEFTGRSIADLGMSAAQNIQAYCENLDPESLCLHGLGHGFIANTSYTEKGLHQAVDPCDTSTSDGIRAGKCKSGVYMEYFNQTMLGTDAQIFPVNKENVYAPCAGFSDSDLPICAVELPRVWQKAFWRDTATSSEAIAKTADYCEALPNPTAAGACFIGIGNNAYILAGGQ